ncbi:quinone-dependent dihydroorotate dehydrogenase [Risungbinella massiliensis]|uniref:quinone-dependent dihydroorotate dehydrogenase n=1 Tax=Risungbinella massiliensis TaxID=1329796 RepID=UPI0005CB8790|nr:quinone-dependent dihydroorotate dehydrogenase [Risungbinella massiliensis]
MPYSSLKKWIFRLDPEKAHHLTIQSLKWMQSQKIMRDLFTKQTKTLDERLRVQLFGIDFANPVGLAAGFDKHANVYSGLASLGFGFIEVGTITPRPQAGNPQPRLFRSPADDAVINRMGFNNDGVAAAKKSFHSLPRPDVPIGINLGKNKDTPNEEASKDYLIGLRELYLEGDYFVINISSPNTQGLRDLQEESALKELLDSIVSQRESLVKETGRKRPLFVKLAPDLSDDQLGAAVETILAAGIDGIVATNTTLGRDGLTDPNVAAEAGGLSGKPVRDKSTEIIRKIYQITRGRIPIIGVGGIFTGKDAWDKIRAGADLVQVYTGMIYRGPYIAKYVNEELTKLLDQHQISSIRELVGSDVT